ncbi:hypothetical protein FALBO_336 [Fusarium albosuccineum]|uniref:Uncharacterized protein n=1 Tax=Fusarium albosuccineum TaxID=1237068 RepID=A0A8H4PME3_9HYPO|nr:hypothetical protein FALBO_336 [Fusarium albosuccineum]
MKEEEVRKRREDKKKKKKKRREDEGRKALATGLTKLNLAQTSQSFFNLNPRALSTLPYALTRGSSTSSLRGLSSPGIQLNVVCTSPTGARIAASFLNPTRHLVVLFTVTAASPRPQVADKSPYRFSFHLPSSLALSISPSTGTLLEQLVHRSPTRALITASFSLSSSILGPA